MANIDEKYWREYYRIHNEARFVELVQRFYAPDATFANPREQFRGHEALVEYFRRAAEFVKLTLTPIEIWLKPGATATELEFTAQARQDVPDFVTGRLRAGQTVRIRMAATYRMKDALILHASVFWGRQTG